MTKDEAIEKLILEIKLIANCGSVEDFTVAGIRCTLRDALYRYNQMSDQPTERCFDCGGTRELRRGGCEQDSWHRLSDQPTLREIAEQIISDFQHSEELAWEMVERAMRLMAEAVARWHGHIPTEEDMADYAEQAEALLKAGAKHLRKERSGL